MVPLLLLAGCGHREEGRAMPQAQDTETAPEEPVPFEDPVPTAVPLEIKEEDVFIRKEYTESGPQIYCEVIASSLEGQGWKGISLSDFSGEEFIPADFFQAVEELEYSWKGEQRTAWTQAEGTAADQELTKLLCQTVSREEQQKLGSDTELTLCIQVKTGRQPGNAAENDDCLWVGASLYSEKTGEIVPIRALPEDCFLILHMKLTEMGTSAIRSPKFKFNVRYTGGQGSETVPWYLESEEAFDQYIEQGQFVFALSGALYNYPEQETMPQDYEAFCAYLQQQYTQQELESFAQRYLTDTLQISEDMQQNGYSALVQTLREQLAQQTVTEEMPERTAPAVTPAPTPAAEEPASGNKSLLYLVIGAAAGAMGVAAGGLSQRKKKTEDEGGPGKALPLKQGAASQKDSQEQLLLEIRPILDPMRGWVYQTEKDGWMQRALEPMRPLQRDEQAPAQEELEPAAVPVPAQPEEAEPGLSETEQEILGIFCDSARKKECNLTGAVFMNTDMEIKRKKDNGLCGFYSVAETDQIERAEFVLYGDKLYPNPVKWAGRTRFMAAVGGLMMSIYEAFDAVTGEKRQLLEFEGYTIRDVAPALVNDRHEIVAYGKLMLQKKDNCI